MADYGNGRKRDVAELMATGDVPIGIGQVRALTSEEIAQRLGTTAANVRQIQRRIRDDLGWQAC